ncbi:MAG: shikimate dehydrogenase [Solirubrobacteraceae bacterium]|jgi:shikimate dehydrogenase|nr:shikimate dehydrogenase [Solirubrobacteraceae bacterium]
MHEAAYAAAGIEGWRYQRLPVPPERFAETVRALPAAGFAGVNVTLPHKAAGLALADSATEAARAIGAANSLTFADGAIEADNTDAPGFLAALDTPAQGLRATVLGAGGSARAVVWALREAGAADVAVWNRTPERARALADELGARAVSAPEPGDLLVNCTSVGLDPGADPFEHLPLTSGDLAGWGRVVDLAYAGDGATAFLRAAREAGATTVDGLEVLVRQGALSFERWTGVPAPLDAMRAGAGVQARGE